ncbi:uncharacterized protein LOC133824049 [Humulus lupulus]|uniref:uncharacterized protein LOC133824049 n=1 Tax=Humulus lupulus TaxID=3486 RepID=UPI002B40A5B1|nr:uncharacterized protein LOC133824049 [Humulus lupulus]
MKETLAEPCPDDDEDEEGPDEAPLDRGGFHQQPPSLGGCPPCAPYDLDIAPPSQDQQDIPGCSVYPDPEGHDAFTQAPLDLGSPGADYVGLPDPPFDQSEPRLSIFTVPPPASASGSPVPIQPGAPVTDGEPWVTRMAMSFGQRYIQLASSLPVSDWNGLGNVTQADLGENLRRSMAWAYTLAMRFADSSNNLSASAAERNCLTTRVQELEEELNETNAKLSKVRTKFSNLSSKRKEVKAKTKRLEDKVTHLDCELQEAKATAAASQQRVTQLEAEVEALMAELQSAQERSASLEAERATIERRSVDRALYNVWRQDPNFDFSSFDEHVVARVALWSAHGRRP